MTALPSIPVNRDLSGKEIVSVISSNSAKNTSAGTMGMPRHRISS